MLPSWLAQLQRQGGYTPKSSNRRGPPPSTIFPSSPGEDPIFMPNGSRGFHHSFPGAPPCDTKVLLPTSLLLTMIIHTDHTGLTTLCGSPRQTGDEPNYRHDFPWYAVHHKLGMTLNHPLELGQLHIDKEAFLAYFIYPHYNPNKLYRAFVGRFPSSVARE